MIEQGKLCYNGEENYTQIIRSLASVIDVVNVSPFISVSEFAKQYFGKSASWLHQRINGNAVHGKVATFTPAELNTLANALKDVAGKLTHAAAAFV